MAGETAAEVFDTQGTAATAETHPLDGGFPPAPVTSTHSQQLAEKTQECLRLQEENVRLHRELEDCRSALASAQPATPREQAQELYSAPTETEVRELKYKLRIYADVLTEQEVDLQRAREAAPEEDVLRDRVLDAVRQKLKLDSKDLPWHAGDELRQAHAYIDRLEQSLKKMQSPDRSHDVARQISLPTRDLSVSPQRAPSPRPQLLAPRRAPAQSVQVQQGVPPLAPRALPRRQVAEETDRRGRISPSPRTQSPRGPTATTRSGSAGTMLAPAVARHPSPMLRPQTQGPWAYA